MQTIKMATSAFRSPHLLRVKTSVVKNRNKIAAFGLFSSAYCFSLSKAREANSEIVRLGMAGSVVVLIVESTFYMLDSINSKTKVCQDSISFVQMIDSILKTEGPSGLFKGISATFYGSICYGALYFHLYPFLKEQCHDWFA